MKRRAPPPARREKKMTFTSIQGYFEVPEVLKTKTGFIEEPRVAFNPPAGRRLSGRATAIYSFEEAPMPRMVVKMSVGSASAPKRVGVVLEFLTTTKPGCYNVRTRIPRGYAMENVTFTFTDRSKSLARGAPFGLDIAFSFDLFAKEADQALIEKARSIDCVICLDKPASVLITDCGHAVICKHCVARFLEAPATNCPICRAKATHLTRFDDTPNALLPKIKI